MSIMTVNEPCVNKGCSNHTIMHLETDAYESWINGTLIQDAFPELTVDQREFLITGICPECQDELYNFLEDEEEVL